MGFRAVRRGFYWTSVEKEKGVYDFSDYDVQMGHAKKLGLTVVGCLFGNNKLYEDDGLGGIQTEPGRKGFANFAAALAEHYKDHDVLREVWNEPNVRSFSRKNGQHNSKKFAEEYTALVKETASAMLAADPDCVVVAGSVSNYWGPSYEWTESCFKERILKTGNRCITTSPDKAGSQPAGTSFDLSAASTAAGKANSRAAACVNAIFMKLPAVDVVLNDVQLPSRAAPRFQ